jgi:mRNA-degrading endonuclease RelE of RelBE toxin-antitoxin system
MKNYTVKTTETFEKNIKRLSKKYRQIKKDLLPILNRLASGEFIGDSISGCDNILYKTRVASSDQKKGKRGGFRLIYSVHDGSEDNEIILHTIYAKPSKSDISSDELKNIMKELGL